MKNHAIESLKFIAIFGIFLAHIRPFLFDPFIHLPYEMIFKVTVPFFFICSGYFAYSKLKKDPWPIAWQYTKRLLSLYIIWCVLYSFVPMLFPDSLNNLIQGEYYAVFKKHIGIYYVKAKIRPINFLFNGPAPHLWYLPALWSALVISLIVNRYSSFRVLGILAVAFYMAALLGKSYANTPVIGFWDADFNMRNGPFYALIFVYAGMLLAHLKVDGKQLSTRLVWLVMLLSLSGQTIEAFILQKINGTSLHGHDYLIFTLPYAVGVMLIALKYPHFGEKSGFSRLGQYTLGVYVSHLLVVGFVQKMLGIYIASSYLYTFAAFVLCVFVVFLMNKHRWSRRLIE